MNIQRLACACWWTQANRSGRERKYINSYVLVSTARRYVTWHGRWNKINEKLYIFPSYHTIIYVFSILYIHTYLYALRIITLSWRRCAGNGENRIEKRKLKNENQFISKHLLKIQIKWKWFSYHHIFPALLFVILFFASPTLLQSHWRNSTFLIITLQSDVEFIFKWKCLLFSMENRNQCLFMYCQSMEAAQDYI